MKAQRYRFGELVRLFRKHQGLTQADLAQEVGVSERTISDWERGLSLPETRERVERLAQVLYLNDEECNQLLVAAHLQPPSISGESPLPVLHEQIWAVPYRRNPFFTGRAELLQLLRERLKTASSAALSQPQAMSGLGGIGKTQTALEYAYQYRRSYQAVFWIRAASREIALADFVALAECLQLPEKHEADQDRVLAAVLRWFATYNGWLLILDNADDLDQIRDLLPDASRGHLLLTTRAQALGGLAQPITVETMGMMESALFLLRRANRLSSDARLEQAHEADLAGAEAIAIEMDFLPLALDQAGAYIEETGCSLIDYLGHYRTRRQALLRRRGGLSDNYPASVATTWSLSFELVRQANPAAVDLLHLCAFLDPDSIPKGLFQGGHEALSPALQRVAADALQLDQAIENLRKFSLVQSHPHTQTLSIHRLVQAVLKDAMKPAVQRRWAERAVRALNKVFPQGGEVATWPQCQHYLSQVQACSGLIQQYTLASEEAADLLARAALYLQAHALYEQAIPLNLRALAIGEQVLGPNHLDVATLLNNLASVYEEQGNYAEAEALLDRALVIREQFQGPNHLDIATLLNNLASVYRRQGKFPKAKQLYQRALTLYEQQAEAEHPDTATILNNLASLCEVQGEYVEAEQMYKRAIALYEHHLGAEHPDTARSLHNLAGLYDTQGKYEQAETLMQLALASRRQHLEPDHPDIAQSINNLAGLYVFQGKYEQAEVLYQEVLSIRKRILGPSHPETAQTLNNLAEVYRVQNKIEQAASSCLEALAIRKQVLGLNHIDTAQSVHTLAMLCEDQSEYEQAELLMQQVLKVYQKHLGPNHPQVATCLNDMSSVYCVQGKYEQALSLLEQALMIWEQALGLDHPNVALGLENLASLLRQMQRGQEATPLEVRAQAIRAKQKPAS